MMGHIESLEGRAMFSATPAAVATVLAEDRTIVADDRAVLAADAAGLRSVTAAIRTGKLTKTDAAALRTLTTANAADLRTFATAVRSVNTALTTDANRLVAAEAALAKKPTNATLATRAAAAESTLSAAAPATLSALTAADAKLTADDAADASALPGAISAANLITDGGFEDPDVGTGGTAEGTAGSSLFNYYASGPDNGESVPSSGTTIDGAWQVAAGSVDVVGPVYWTAFDGSQSLDLDGINPGTLYQDVPTVAGRQYTLSFEFAGNPDGGGGQEPKVMVVTAGSASQQFSFDSSTHSDAAPGWTLETVDFTATGSTTRVEFASQDASTSVQGPALDDVSVTADTAAAAQPTLVSAVGAYQSDLSTSVQTLNTAATTALNTGVSNVLALYA